MQRNRSTRTIDCLGHAHAQNSDFQEVLFVVGDVETTVIRWLVLRIWKRFSIMRRAEGVAYGLDDSVEESKRNQRQGKERYVLSWLSGNYSQNIYF